jgi:hypothetical protein
LSVATGYDRTIRAGLVADTYIKVYDAAVKPKLAQKLTKGLQVTSFDPSDLKNTDNFFVFVSNWQNTTIMIESHLKTFFMDTVFNVVDLVEVTPATSTAGAAGAAPTITPAVYAIQELAANLIEEWHSVTLHQVSVSVAYIRQYVSDKVDHDNLIWSFDYIMALCDYDLQHYILSVLEAYPKEIGHTGPMAFHVMATRILQTSDNLAQNVVTGLIQMRLTHFDAENVVELVFTLRNVLKFLNYGTKNSLCPPTIMKILTTIFRGTSVDEFRNYITTLETFHQDLIQKPEELFNKAQTQYENLVTSGRWVKTKKKGSSFLVEGRPAGKNYEDGFTDDSSKSAPSSHGKKVDYDRKGNKIDRKRPSDGASQTRTNSEGIEEIWCENCRGGGRWGNHGTTGHEAWYREYQKNMAIRRKKREENASATDSSSTGTSTQVQTQATFARLHLQHDEELTDGVSFQE